MVNINWLGAGKVSRRGLGTETEAVGPGSLGLASGLLERSPHREALRAGDTCRFQEGLNLGGQNKSLGLNIA